ncbi:MAG: hypothetical protein V4572_00220 [Bacteroidota bacterium]
MEITFDKIHDIAVNAFTNEDIADIIQLKLIGKWCFKFLNSDEKEIILTLPNYDANVSRITFEYLRFFFATYALYKHPKKDNLENKSIFNFFNYKSNNSDWKKYFLKYLGQKKQFIIWEQNVITENSRFLPVFELNENVNRNSCTKISNSLDLFKSIRKVDLINYPICISLENEKIICINSGEKFVPNQIICIDDIQYSKKDEISDIIILATSILAKSPLYSLVLKYPHHRNIHPFLIKNDSKKFVINFNNRFFYNNLNDSEVVFLENEINKTDDFPIVNPSLFFLIVKTSHNDKLYGLLEDFKTNWRNEDFNIYTTPFPKYWLLFINKGLSIEEWQNMFEIDYPNVAQRPIYNSIKEIIKELYNLNWIETFVKVNPEKNIFFFPEMKGLKWKRLNKVYNSFKNHAISLNSNVSFVENLDLSKSENIYLLNGFDYVDLTNKLQLFQNQNFKILIPDFLYFSYQPWVQYQIVNFQKIALSNKIRKVLDENYTSTLQKTDEFLTEISQQIKTDLLEYRKKYFKKNEVFEDIFEELETIEDIELTNDEETYVIDKKEKTKSFTTILITFKLDNKVVELNLSQTEKVFVFRNSLINLSPNSLTTGDYFIRNEDLSFIINDENFLDKFSEIPESVKFFKQRLYNLENAFEKLKLRGLEISTGYYFNSNYVIDKKHQDHEELKLPRKRDWKLICDFLTIDESEMHMAYIARYGRQRKNQIKNLYKEIINELVVNELLGRTEDFEVIRRIMDIVEQHGEVFKGIEEFNLTDISESIISNITNELFAIKKEVLNIKVS